MTDLLVGATVKVLDFPPTVGTFDITAITDISSTAYIEGTPNVRVTFVAPTSGRVLIYTGGGMRDSAGANQVFIHPEIRETNVSGTVVVPTSVTSRYLLSSMGESTAYYYATTATVLSGLTPGATYFGRIMHRVSGGSGADIAARSLIVQPIP